MELSAGKTRSRLQDYIASVANCAVEITELKHLSGGAIQDNWAVNLTVAEGEWVGSHELVLRRDAPSGVAASHGRAHEYQLLKAAHSAGVQVPEPCFLCTDTSILGGPFFLMHRISGEASGYLLVKGNDDPGLARKLGLNLARLHTIQPPRNDLVFLGSAPNDPALAAVERYRGYIDSLDWPMPVLEWGLTWLVAEAPTPGKPVLCHRDYRTGNYMVDCGELTGVLDWEFAGWGDRHEDLGWFCAKCWRFGATGRDAGGISERAPFYEGYEAEAGTAIDPKAVAYWEVMAHVRWAVIAAQQAARHISCIEPSLELALTGHVIPELELEILKMTLDSGHA